MKIPTIDTKINVKKHINMVTFLIFAASAWSSDCDTNAITLQLPTDKSSFITKFSFALYFNFSPIRSPLPLYIIVLSFFSTIYNFEYSAPLRIY